MDRILSMFCAIFNGLMVILRLFSLRLYYRQVKIVKIFWNNK